MNRHFTVLPQMEELLYEYEKTNMLSKTYYITIWRIFFMNKIDTFNTIINITRDHTSPEEMHIEFNNNNPKH